MTLAIVLSILGSHLIADFMMQKGKEGANKHKDNKVLTKHVTIYCLSFFAILTPILVAEGMDTVSWSILVFIITTFGMHWITDYCTSKITHNLYERNEFGMDDRPNFGFFTVIGID